MIAKAGLHRSLLVLVSPSLPAGALVKAIEPEVEIEQVTPAPPAWLEASVALPFAPFGIGGIGSRPALFAKVVEEPEVAPLIDDPEKNSMQLKNNGLESNGLSNTSTLWCSRYNGCSNGHG
jgi:hypothetical protein